MKSRQPQLFEDERNNDSGEDAKTLPKEVLPLIVPSKGKPENRDVELYNKRLKRLKKTQQQYENLAKTIDELGKRYNDTIIPIERELALLIFTFIEKLDSFDQAKGITKKEQDALEHMVIAETHVLMEEFDIDLPKCSQKYMKRHTTDDDKEMMKKMAMEMMGGHMAEIDPDDFLDLDPIAFEERYGEKIRQHAANEQAKAKERWENERHVDSSAQTPAQKRQEQEDALYQSDFKRLFKKLSKELHPDLEQNDHMRIKKQALMQDLNQAKQDKDIFKLLSIERALNDANEIYEQYYTDEQIKRFSEKIMRQEQDWKGRIFQLKHHDPRTRYIYETFYARSKKGIDRKFQEEAENLQQRVADKQLEMAELTSKKKAKPFLKQVHEQIAVQRAVEHLAFGDFPFDDDDEDLPW